MEKPTISRCVSTGTRVYYIDAHVDRKGQHYMSISEIQTEKSPGSKKRRQRIFLHSDNLDKFTSAFQEIAAHINSADHDPTDISSGIGSDR